jgi:hypothetical protein
MNKNNFKLKKVTESDVEFLYDLLMKRDLNSNISHKIMPSFLQHKKFIHSKPYSYWYVIILNDQKIGSVYLTKINEIGFHIKKDFESDELDKVILKILFRKHPKKRFLVNANPKDKKRINFLKNSGFNLIQHTFELKMDMK